MAEDTGTPALAAPKNRRWASPARRRNVPGAGYTRAVRWMRLALPLIAVAMIGLLMAWPHIRDTMTVVQREAAIAPAVGANELLNPRFESKDSENRPFTVTAKRAVQSIRDPEVVILEHPMADIILEDGAWMAAEARNGAWRQKEEKLVLEGDVRLFHDKGYEVKTPKLLIDLQSRHAWSDQPVQGQGPAGTLQASGLEARAAEGVLLFTGPVKLVLNRSIEGL